MSFQVLKNDQRFERLSPAMSNALGQNKHIKVLIPYDGSESGNAALDDLRRTGLPQGLDAIVAVTNVWLPLSPYEITRAVSLRGGPLQISGEVIAGKTARCIIDQAKNWHADLIVVGTHQRRRLKRLLLGSASVAIANRAHCSVRVIRDLVASRNGESLPRRSNASAQHVGRVYRLEDDLGWRKAA